MKRRDFLMTTAAGWLSSYFSVSFFEAVALAQQLSAKTPNLIVVRLNGAVDSLQGLNPWVLDAPDKSDLFTAYEPKDVLRNIEGTSINLGPSAHELAPFASKMAIVNGIWMGTVDLGHPFALQYMTSGRTQEKAPHLTALIAKQEASKKKFLVTNGPIQQLDYKIKIMQTGNIVLGFKSDAGDEDLGGLVNVYQNKDGINSNYKALFGSTERLEKFNSVMTQLSALPKIEGLTGDATNDEDAVVAALASGLTSIAQLDFSQQDGGPIDNHSQYADLHPKNTKVRFDRIARLITNLNSCGLLNKTLAVVITEFSRTPALNGNEGKDHNYFDNSALLVGYGINGGKVVGGHRLFGKDGKRDKPQLSGEFIDFKSGEILRSSELPQDVDQSKLPVNVDLIRPSHLMTTVAEIILPNSAKMFGDAVPSIPGIIKSQ